MAMNHKLFKFYNHNIQHLPQSAYNKNAVTKQQNLNKRKHKLFVKTQKMCYIDCKKNETLQKTRNWDTYFIQ